MKEQTNTLVKRKPKCTERLMWRGIECVDHECPVHGAQAEPQSGDHMNAKQPSPFATGDMAAPHKEGD